MENYELIIGIDISKLTLDIIGINLKGEVVKKHNQIENDKSKINGWIKPLTKVIHPSKILITFEDTGIYSYKLAMAMSELGIAFCRLSGFEVNRSKGLLRGKSDSIDALIIAEFALSRLHKLQPSVLAEMKITKLRILNSQREKLVKSINTFSLNKENEDFVDKQIMKDLNRSNTSILKNLKKNLALVESQLKETIKEDEQLEQDFKLVQSIPGIGPQTAIYMLITTQGFKSFENARQMACYAGVAPFPFQSGTSIRGRTKVSPMADKKMKSLLNMCALSAIKYDHETKSYFERKVDEGKNKMLVLNNVRNKLLTRIFAVVNRQQPYVNTQKFAA